MSYTSDIRDELIAIPIKPLCCCRAYLYGMLYCAEVDGETVTATFPVVKEAARQPHEQAVSLIHTLFSREATVTHETRGAHRYARVSFDYKAAAKNLRSLIELPEEEADCESLGHTLGFKCEHCSAHFLRGAFIACATVNDPFKSYHLELKPPEDGRAVPLSILLAESGIELGWTVRGGRASLVSKNCSTILEFLGHIGATSSYFVYINTQIERSIRNNENRATNCVTSNIKRAVNTGTKHLTAIQYLEDHDLISSLPEDLQFTARLRLNNSDITLSELADLHFPPVSKSGIYHRLEKILAFYEKVSKS